LCKSPFGNETLKKLDIFVRLPYNNVVMKKSELSSTNDKEKKFHQMNDVLIEIAKVYMKWHDKEQDFGVEENLCRAEIHSIQAIGNNEGINITQLAKLLKVTKPTVSERLSKLSKLKLVSKISNVKNNKEVLLALTDKGWIAYENHELKHHKIYNLFENYFGDESTQFVESFIEQLKDFSKFLTVVRKEKDFL
jgi:DNA-binding MarR family transcriptional regulator